MTAPSRARLRVPATSANLGPGFDALGLALGLHLRVEARRSDRDGFAYRGEGDVPATADNLLHRGFTAACELAGAVPFPVAFVVENPIPMARGLGSSSAALVAGAAAADVLLGGTLGRDGVFEATVAIEGHPDNVAPAVYGGFTVSALDRAGRYLTRALEVPAHWRLLFGVPPFELLTEDARRVVPTTYPRQDVVHSASRAALWTLAVATDEPELLRTACLDVIHQPYRSPLIPGFERCLDEAFAAGAYAAYLSGAGPTVAVVAEADDAAGVVEALERFAGPGGRVLDLEPAKGYGATAVEEVEPDEDEMTHDLIAGRRAP